MIALIATAVSSQVKVSSSFVFTRRIVGNMAEAVKKEDEFYRSAHAGWHQTCGYIVMDKLSVANQLTGKKSNRDMHLLIDL